MKKNTDFIYLLRFIAAFWVVVKHYSPVRNALVDNGGEAVSFFFLLSGFILVVAYEKQIVAGTLQAAGFYVKRIARIYPLYLMALVLTLAFHFFVQETSTKVLQKLPLELLMLQSWAYPGSINYVAWSISCELFFYLLFPIYIVKWQRQPLGRSVLIVAAIISATVAAGYFLEALDMPFLRPDHKQGYLFEHPVFRMPIFLVGNVLGLFYVKNRTIPARTVWGMFGAGCVFFALYYLRPVELGLSLKQVGLVLIYVSLLIALLQNEIFSKRWLSFQLFIMLGDISFGVYLLQGPVFSFLRYYGSGLGPALQFWAGSALLLGLSYMVYLFFEKPVRAWIVGQYTAWEQTKTIPRTTDV